MYNYGVAGKKLELGESGRTVAKNVGRFRRAAGMNYTDLSSYLQILGRDIPPLAVRRVEDGNRRVDVDDLAALAVALRVSPAALLMPCEDEDGAAAEAKSLVRITGWHKPIPARVIWDWLIAVAPLVYGTSVEPSWPAWVREAWNEQLRPARRKLLEGMYREVPGGVPDDLPRGGGDGED